MNQFFDRCYTADWHSHHLRGFAFYYRGTKSGAWVARRYLGDSLCKEEKVAQADDVLNADGANVLDFFQAQARAREWFTRPLRGGEAGAPTPRTVKEVTEEYLAWFKEMQNT